MSDEQKRPRMLLVDDEPALLDCLERLFKGRYLVERASSVKEARGHLTHGPLDVLITDRNLPDGSGIGLLGCAQAERPEALRILLSGALGGANEGVLLADAVVLKPADSQALEDAILRARAGRLTKL